MSSRRLLPRDDDASDTETLAEELDDNSHDEGEDRSNDKLAEDPFEAFQDLPPENRNILTLRALAVGVFCGALVNASNIYLGLKSGWTSGANIFAVS